MRAGDVRKVELFDLTAQRERLSGEIREAIAEVVAQGQFVMGPQVEELERVLEQFTGASSVVTCANGTDALELAFRALGLMPGDGVIVPAFTFCATAEAVAALGAVPVFADVDERTFNVCQETVEQAMQVASQRGLRVVGLVAVDLYGLPAPYDALTAFARQHGVWVVADAAQSLGSRCGERRAGTLAPVTVTSFFPSKPLGCYGDGGAVFTDSPALADLLRSLRQHGKGHDKYDNVRIGRNSRLDTIQAAILLRKLTVFEDELGRRQRIAERYSSRLAGVVDVPSVPKNVTSAWALYTIRVHESRRDYLQESLRERGVGSGVYYPKPLHQQRGYQQFPCPLSGLRTSERLSRQVLSLPMSPYLTEDAQEHVLQAVQDSLRH